MSFRVVVFGVMAGEEPISLFSKGRRACGQWYRYFHLPCICPLPIITSVEALHVPGVLLCIATRLPKHDMTWKPCGIVRANSAHRKTPHPQLSKTPASDLPPPHPRAPSTSALPQPSTHARLLIGGDAGEGWMGDMAAPTLRPTRPGQGQHEGR